MNILIIEDDVFLCEKMVSAFRKIDYINLISTVHCMSTFTDIYTNIEIYDVILVDLEIPPYTRRDHGYEIIDRIHEKNPNIPIIVFSGKNDIDAIQKAFFSGVTDYIIKPVRLKELEVRVLHIFHSRKQEKRCEQGIYTYYEIVYNSESHTFLYGNIPIFLSKKSKHILLLFLKSPEKIIKKTELIEKIWGDYEGDFSRKIGVSIHRLRRSLCPFGISHWIENMPGEGYMMRRQNYDSSRYPGL